MPLTGHVRFLRERVGHALLELPSVGGILRDDGGRILLVRHDDGVWSTPGGAVEPLEAPADAVAREVFEETGVEVVPRRILGVYGGPGHVVAYGNGDRTSYCMIFFECDVVSGLPRPDGVETHGVRWVARSELAGLGLRVWLREILEDAFARRPEARFAPAGWRPPT